METITETFIKKTADINDMTIVRQVVKKEEFQLTLAEIERMEKNSQVQIDVANQIIETMNNKLAKCRKLRELL